MTCSPWRKDYTLSTGIELLMQSSARGSDCAVAVRNLVTTLTPATALAVVQYLDQQ